MTTLDKWQRREIREHAQNNGLSTAEAAAELFPAEESPEAPAAEAAEETTEDASAEAAADAPGW